MALMLPGQQQQQQWPRQRSSWCTTAGVAVVVLLLAPALPGAAAQEQQQSNASNCGGEAQACCLNCPPDVASSECDQLECTGTRTCHVFGVKGGGKRLSNVCLQAPPECGSEGHPCCYSNDPTSEAERCDTGLTCISERVGYANEAHYTALVADPDSVNSTRLMGTCKNMTISDCGKRYYPCGAAARRQGCPEEVVVCSGAGDFCAAPSDTMLGASRCLPLPLRCGQRNNACCPANADGSGSPPRERWNQDGLTPVPYCSDGASMCVWQHKEYAKQGLRILNEAGYSKQLLWDGYFARGYGQNRCLPVPESCGSPGQPCCPSMLDQRLSGMVHNRRFKHQPCNYQEAGQHGIFCKGAWQGDLLNVSQPLGVCTLNTADCGKLGRQCCREDVPETGPVMICETSAQPGTHYCTEANVCTKCPATPVTQLQKENCLGPSGSIEAGRSARRFGRAG